MYKINANVKYLSLKGDMEWYFSRTAAAGGYSVV